ncbi:MAG: hypothetical protein J6C46_08050 [Clostridia bacterium]|nr:hypothetical protein [Clostridia bacterium]
MEGRKDEMMSTIQVEFNMNKIYKRFTTGKIGEKLRSLLDSLEFRSYLKENLIDFIKEQAERISDIESRQEFLAENTQEILETEVKFNITVDMFWKSIEQWLESGGSIEKIIIQNMNIQTMQNIVFLLQQIKKSEVDEIVHFEDEDTRAMMHKAIEEQEKSGASYAIDEYGEEMYEDEYQNPVTFDMFGHVTKKEYLN